MKETEDERYIHYQPGQTVIISNHKEDTGCCSQWGTVKKDGVEIVCRECHYWEKQLKPSKMIQ